MNRLQYQISDMTHEKICFGDESEKQAEQTTIIMGAGQRFAVDNILRRITLLINRVHEQTFQGNFNGCDFPC